MISDVESPFTSTGLLNSGFAAALQDSSHQFKLFHTRINKKKMVKYHYSVQFTHFICWKIESLLTFISTHITPN